MNTDKSKRTIHHEEHEEIEVKQGQNFLFTMKDMNFMKKSIYLCDKLIQISLRIPGFLVYGRSLTIFIAGVTLLFIMRMRDWFSS